MKKLNTLKISLLGTLGGLLGAWGGADQTSKAWRRICIPFLLFHQAYNSTQNILTIFVLSLIGILSLGYGIPSINDEGSTLGKFWAKIWRFNPAISPAYSSWTDFSVRATIAVGKCCSLAVMPILQGNWVIYGWCCAGIIVFNSVIESTHPKGMFTLFGKKLLWEEFLIYFSDTLFGLFIIYGGLG